MVFLQFQKVKYIRTLIEGSVVDITERKRREEAELARMKAESATETKTEFFSQNEP